MKNSDKGVLGYGVSSLFLFQLYTLSQEEFSGKFLKVLEEFNSVLRMQQTFQSFCYFYF